MHAQMTPPVAIDLFAGGGGLTVGLKKGGFAVTSAVEVDSHAFATYVANHPEVRAFKQDIQTVDGESITRSYDGVDIDLIAGCPPCQGFTSLTAKYKRMDPRNELLLEMARLIEEIVPRAIMMENVLGIMGRGKYLLEQFVDQIRRLGYKEKIEVLQVADYGVPQSRRRCVLLAGHGFEISMPAPTHIKDGGDGLPRWKTVRQTIGGMPEPITLAEAKRLKAFSQQNWHIIRSLSDANKLRLKYAKPGKKWTEIPENSRPDCHKGSYRGFSNVYGRMEWDQVAPTITAGCTTLSKGRYGHPSADRTISVREAALLQTFPPDYKIDTRYIDHACNIIGNALPCEFAAIIAKKCAEALQ